MQDEQKNREAEIVNTAEAIQPVNEQELIEELQVIEAAELSVGNAFHAFRFKM